MTDTELHTRIIAHDLIRACEKAMDLRIPPAERERLKMIIAHWHDPERMELISLLNRYPTVEDGR